LQDSSNRDNSNLTLIVIDIEIFNYCAVSSSNLLWQVTKIIRLFQTHGSVFGYITPIVIAAHPCVLPIDGGVLYYLSVTPMAG
jgi:hypothetical protein